MASLTKTNKSNTFIGYSFIQGLKPLYNVAIVEQDLLNQINTRKGELMMQPEFGCIVWDLLFELKTPETISLIKEDLIRIINSDPRVQLQELIINEQPYGYTGYANLYYNQFATTNQLNLNFSSQIFNVDQ